MSLLVSLCRAAVVVALVGMIGIPVATAAKASDTGYPRLMQGPMVGAVTGTDARIWVRTSGEFTAVIVYDEAPGFPSPEQTKPVLVKKADDYTAVITIPGLAPSTDYFYKVLVDGIPDRYLEGL